ncbi:MAG: metal ABC transporter substrate-binding protein [Parcubacteria group bacterium]|jgi:zinc transport system substrate-binding protein
MKQKIFIAIIVILALIAVVFLLKSNQKKESPSARISVVTTLFPLYDFAKNVGGDHVDVSLLLPPGVEAHSFEPTPSDIITINRSDVFVYTGAFMEPWVEDVIAGMQNDTVTIVNTSAHIALINENEDHGDESSHSGIDPHVWLDFDNAQKMVDAITDALAQKDPTHAGDYRTNAVQYKETLAQLDHTYATTLAQCRRRDIVYGGHYAFGYMSKKYDLRYEAAYGISPNAEPSAQDLAQLVEQIKKNGITTIFYEDLLNPKIAETLARETNTKLLALTPAGNISKEDYQTGTTFVMLMEKNLQNLAQGLSCN